MHTGKLRIVVFVIGLVALLSGAWLLTVPADGPAIAARQPAAAEAAVQPVQSASHQMQQTAAVRVQTSASLLGVGDTLVVTVTAANVESPLSAFQFDLTYNPSVLAYVGSEWGGFLESTGRSVACLDPIPAWGTARLACASTGAEDGPTSGGVLAVLTFRTVSNGRSDLTPNNVLLPDTGRPPELQAATAEPASVSVCIPAGEVSISGPPTSTEGISVTFTATVNPVSGTASLPVTFTWQASGLETLVHYDALSDTATFTWTEAGPQAVTVTVANECGGVTASQSINIEAAVQRIYLPLILRNAGGTQSAARPPLNRSLASPLLALGLGMVLAGGGGPPFRRPRLPWQKIISIITLINLLAGLVPLPAAQTVRAVEEAARPPDIAPIPAPLPSVSPTAPLSTGWADLDADHDVDFDDLTQAATHWNCAAGQTCYDADLDTGGFSGRIDAYDLAAVGNEYDIATPELTITAPEENGVTGGDTVQVGGLVTDTHAVTVTVNGVAATVNGGAFQATVPVTAGNFLLSVVAEDALGAVTTTDRLVFVDQEGPFITVGEPANRQSVYTLQPTVVLTYTDFYTAVNTATLHVTLTDEDGSISDITNDLTIGAASASGQVSASLTEDTAYTLTATMEDALGNSGTVQSTFYVPTGAGSIVPPTAAPDAGWVSGRVFDSSTCEGGAEQPIHCDGLRGALVTLTYADRPTMTITGTVVSGPDGFFAFPVAETEHYWLRIEKNGYTYGQREADIVRDRSTPVNEIYLTPLENSQACDSSGCVYTNTAQTMKAEIPAGAIRSGDAVDFSATLFEQVEYLPSGELPEGTWETFGFNLGGDSIYSFTKPITVWVKNTLGFAPGTPIPLGYWNQATQEWEHAGVSWVDDTGAWVVFTTTHLSTYDCNDPVTVQQPDINYNDLLNTWLSQHRGEDTNSDCGEDNEGNSSVALRSGALRETLRLPEVQTTDGAFAPTLAYDSNRAAPSQLIEVRIRLRDIPGVELLDYVQAELFIEGEKTANFTFQANLREGELGHFRYLWDGKDAQGRRLPPGVYQYALHVRIPYRSQYYFALNRRFGGPPDYNAPTGVWVNATADGWFYGTVRLDSDPGGPFGMGWTLQGMQRLYEDESGHIMIDDGYNVNEYYFPGKDLLESGIFSQTSRLMDGASGQGASMQVASMQVAGEQGASRQVAGGASRAPGLASPPRDFFRRPQYDTSVSGDIITNTTWTLANSPYVLTGDVVVTHGVTLTVEPGVVVKGQDNTELRVLGHLAAIGTVTQPITFTSSTDTGPQQWAGLVFDGGTGDLRHVTVRYGGDGGNSGLSTAWSGSNIAVKNVVTGQVRIESSRVVSAAYGTPYTDYGLYAINSHLAVSDTLFANNGNEGRDYALYATGDSVVTVTNSTFQDNVGWAAWLEADDVHRMSGNFFSGNGYDRVRIPGGSTTETGVWRAQTGLEGYDLQGDVTVPAGVTLTLEPGTAVMGEDSKEFQVFGHLSAIGTETQPITFTSSTDSGPQQWSGLVFDGGTGDLRHVTVRYGGDGSNSGLPGDWSGSNIAVKNVVTGQVRIESSRVVSAAYGTPYTDYGLYAINSHLAVSDTLFANNGNEGRDYALYATGDSVVTVTNSTFQDNVGWAAWMEVDDVHRMSGNLFSGNGHDRVRIPGGSTAETGVWRAQSGLAGYDLQDDVRVPAGVTLTVEPGVQVMGEGYAELKVQGHLSAVGTETQPITFTSSADSGPQQWAGLVFDGGTGELRHVTVRYGGDQDSLNRYSNITVQDVLSGAVRIESSVIREEYGYYSSSTDYGLYVENSRVVVSDTLFANNGNEDGDYALYATGDSVITVTHSTFQDNVGWAAWMEVDDVHRMSGNLFSGNGHDRVRIPGGSTAETGVWRAQSGLAGYDLQDDVRVPAGVTLTVEPGVQVMGEGYAELKVQGHLSAVGTETQPITFTSSADSGPQQWAGLVFDGGTGELRHVTVRYGGDQDSLNRYSNITVQDVLSGAVRIESSVIREEYGYYSSSTDYGLYVENSRVVVSDTLLANNGNNSGDYALYATGNSTVTLLYSIFEGNRGYPLRIPVSALSELRGNVSISNEYDRVRLYGDATLSTDVELSPWKGLDGYEFEDNLTVPQGVTLTVEPGQGLYWASGKGLTVHGGLYAVGTVENPITFTSSADSGPNQWNGITFGDGAGRLEHATIRYAVYGLTSADGDLDLRYATVQNNRYGIHLTGAGGDFFAAGCDISGNTPYYDSYGLRNDTAATVDARFNWWGDETGPWHGEDNPDGQGDRIYGDVLFDPWLEMKAQDMSVHNRTPADNSILTYSPASHTYTRHYPNGTVVHFNTDGSHDYTQDAQGNKRVYTYNADGTLATIGLLPPGESSPRWTWTFSYTDGHLTAISDPAGRVTTFQIDEHGDLAAVIFPDGATRAFTYDAEHRMTNNEDGLGNQTTYIYDEHGRVRQSILPPRPVYDPQTDTYTTIQPTFVYTPSQTAYQLVNDLTPGDVTSPTDPLVTSDELVDKIAFGRGGYSGHSNEWGSMEDVTDALGRTTLYEHDDANRITRAVWPDGSCVEYTYDSRGNRLSESRMGATQCALDPAERDPSQVQTTQYTYEPRFNLVKSKRDPLGYTTVYTYDYEVGQGERGLPVIIQYPPVEDEHGVLVTPTVTYEYNSYGQVVRETDVMGVVTCYTYTQGTADEASDGTFAPGVTPVPGLLTQVTRDCGGLNQTTTYRLFDGAGNPQAIAGYGAESAGCPACGGGPLAATGVSAAHESRLAYDGFNRVISHTNAAGVTTIFEYDGEGNLTRKVVDYGGRNVETVYTYDTDGHLLSERSDDGDLVVQKSYAYDINGLRAREQDGAGNVTRYIYDEADQLVNIIRPDGGVITRTYAPAGQLETETDAEGHVTRYTYDGFGRKVRVVQDEGGLNLTTVYTYDLDNRLIATQDAAGTVTRYEYDSWGRQVAEVRVVDGQTLTVTATYNLAGLIVSETDERGSVTTHEYDALGRRVRTVQDVGGLNLTTVYTYDLFNNLVAMEDPRGTVTTYEYDDLNRLIRETRDAGGLNLVTAYEYDALGNRTAVTTPDGIVQRTEYNGYGQPVRVVEDADGAGYVTTYEYDGGLNMVRVSDPNGNVTRYTYTPLGVVASETRADGGVITYEYDRRGLLTGRTAQDGSVITYEYDGVGRLTRRAFSDGTVHTFAYDGMGRMVSAASTGGSHTVERVFAYNEMGDVVSQTQTLDGAAYTTRYAYDYTGGVMTTTYPSGAAVRRERDVFRRTTRVQEDGADVAAFTYDDGTGQWGTTYANGLVVTQQFDPLWRVTQVGSSLATYAYGYDAGGNRIWTEHDGEYEVYVHDGSRQVTTAYYGADNSDPAQVTSYDRRVDYRQDGVYNRLAVSDSASGDTAYGPNDGTQSTDPLNRYLTVGGATLTYDGRGNLTADGTYTYTYDLSNKLVGVEGNGHSVEYVYGPLGRRAARIVDGETTWYIYDVCYNILEERDGSGTLQARYIYGDGVDRPLTMERGGAVYTYQQDGLGNVVLLSDASGALVERYEYDIYGQPTLYDGGGAVLSVSAVGNPYLFTAREWEPEVRLYHFRARAYSPGLGRFLQQDPLGPTDGLNLYTYAQNNPVTLTDPMGLRLIPVSKSYDIIPETSIRFPGFSVSFGFSCEGTLTLDTCEHTVQGCIGCEFSASGGGFVQIGGSISCQYCVGRGEEDEGLSCEGCLKVYIDVSVNVSLVEAGCQAGIKGCYGGGALSLTAYAECEAKVNIFGWFTWSAGKWEWERTLVTIRM